MRKYLLGAVSSLALIGSASAADLVPEFKSPVYQNWSGWYAGIDVGAAWGSNIWNDAFDASFSTSYPLNGVLGGAHAGWNYQAGPIVIGGEADFAFTNARGSASVTNQIGEQFGGSANLATTTRWIGTLVARAGVANGSSLYYVVGGFATMNQAHNAERDLPLIPAFLGGGFTQQNVRTTRSGFVLGMGVEFAVYHNWTAKLEYNYMDFGKTSLSFPAVEAEPLTIDQQVHVVKLGISYLFH